MTNQTENWIRPLWDKEQSRGPAPRQKATRRGARRVSERHGDARHGALAVRGGARVAHHDAPEVHPSVRGTEMRRRAREDGDSRGVSHPWGPGWSSYRARHPFCGQQDGWRMA